MFEPGGPTFLEQAHQALCSTQHGYDLIAPKFEHTPYRTPDWVLECLPELIGTCDQALDVCCGTGAGMRMLRPVTRERVVGLDFSKGMLEEAERLLAKDSEGSLVLEYVHRDAFAMDFVEEFDVATCFGALGHVTPDDQVVFLRNIREALKPGGRFIFITGYAPPIWSPVFWLAHGFNVAMRVRNLFIRPPFIMYYLTFLLPKIEEDLEEMGFEVVVESPKSARGYQVVIATKRS